MKGQNVLSMGVVIAVCYLGFPAHSPAANSLNEPIALPDWAIGPFVRPPNPQPVIRPNPDSVFACPILKKPCYWEKAQTYNPAAVVKDGQIVMLYRAQEGPGNTTSRLGYATSSDGIHFKTEPKPVFFPAEDDQKSSEWHGGCEDPRLAESPDGTYILTYTQYTGQPFKTAHHPDRLLGKNPHEFGQVQGGGQGGGRKL